MTWVLGSPTWFGVSACLADVQVTVGDETFDCLQKLYGLERNVLAGFAGNVKTGFAMLARLQRLIDAQKTSQEDPADIRALFQEYPEVARDLFAGLPEELRHGGSAVLIGAAEPAANTIYGCRSRAACFKSPEFAVEEITHREWGSIGSGSGIAAYKAELEKITGDEADGLGQMEVGRSGGHAQVMAQFLACRSLNCRLFPALVRTFTSASSLMDGRWARPTETSFHPTAHLNRSECHGLHRAGPNSTRS